jgi:hypothetical protein
LTIPQRDNARRMGVRERTDGSVDPAEQISAPSTAIITGSP